MKKIITLLLTITFVFSASAQLRWNSLYQTYISQYKDLAIEEMLKHKIPASISNATTGQDERLITMMTQKTSVSEPIKAQKIVMKIIANF